MDMKEEPLSILMADDDPDDRMLVREALNESRASQRLDCVEDGEELLDYLRRRGKYEHLPADHQPRIILLDLNMPRKDGREALKEIKEDPQLRQIPVIVLTTSNAVEDIQRTYDLGASSFLIKPRNFETLVKTLETLVLYWFDTCRLPKT
jgi:CheY-like chemotaxis protein